MVNSNSFLNPYKTKNLTGELDADSSGRGVCRAALLSTLMFSIAPQTKYRLTQFLWGGILLLFIVANEGCSAPPTQYKVIGNANSLEQIQDLYAVPAKHNKAELPALRMEALRDIAMSIGAQAGLAWRAQHINQALNRHAAKLDRIFNFNLLLLDHNVLPPVLVRADDTLNMDGAQAIRIADRTYQIVSQAHFVSVPPHWHNYLEMNYAKPDPPLAGFLPKTTEERAIWRRYAALGWQNGIEQADAIYAENLSRLKRDYHGMLRYRTLLVQGMVSRPQVARTDLGITGDKAVLRINDQILRITALPVLHTQPKRWKPIIITRDPATQ